MGVPTSEVGYTPAMPRREDHEVHKDMWWHWTEKKTLQLNWSDNISENCSVQNLIKPFKWFLRLCMHRHTDGRMERNVSVEAPQMLLVHYKRTALST